jgi:hypothetical protein
VYGSVSPAESLCYHSESKYVHYAALITLYEAPMKKAQRRIGQHGWDTKVGYTKGILLMRILSYNTAFFRV